MDVYRKLNSYQVRGTLTESDVEADFALYKREGRLRMEVDRDDTETVIVYDGDDGWQWRVHPESDKVTHLNSDKTNWLAREARFEDLLLAYDELDFRAELLGRVALDATGELVYQIRLTSIFTPEQYDIFLNAYSYVEVQRNYRPDIGQPVLETSFYDYREVDGIMVPFRVENRMDGELVSVVRVKAVDLNIGILSFYFKRPEGLTVVEQPEAKK